jgi:Zn-dependent protease with chaperone function
LPARRDSPRQTHDHRLVFRLQLTLGALGLATSALAVAAAVRSVHRQAAPAHEVVIAGQHVTYPELNVAAAALLALAAIGAAVLGVAAWASWRQLTASRRLVRRMPVLGPLPGYPGVSVVDSGEPHAFCAGYLRPAIYISSAALELLSADELGAVLTHEQHHRHVRDPLRLAAARVLTQSLFFLPALRRLHDRFAELAEVGADEAAIRAGDRGRAALASALLAFDAGDPAGAAGISPERVDSLLGRPARRRLPSALLLLALVTLSGLAVIVWRASEAASAHATFNLPVVSSQPCVLILALLAPLVALAALATTRRLSPRVSRRPVRP